MDFKTFSEIVRRQFDETLPFVVYSLPDSGIIEGYFQKNHEMHTSELLEEDGFVLAPFDDRFKTFVIPSVNSKFLQSEIDFSEIEKKNVVIDEEEIDQVSYENLIKETIQTIKKGEAKKIVFSRKKDFALREFSLQVLIERLFSAYPTAFRYLWFHPQTGIWCGATPETLVDIKENSFKTMALAGTQKYSESQIHWGAKELEEQQFVTDAILDNLKGLVEDIILSETHSHRAGDLLHLRTLISGNLADGREFIYKLTQALHPTPAVCGTPKELARNYIIEREGYLREYYTGFIGPINDKATSALLMVNLRCMKIEGGKASIYVGGGITADSAPADEWKETQNKMQTMLQVLQPML